MKWLALRLNEFEVLACRVILDVAATIVEVLVDFFDLRVIVSVFLSKIIANTIEVLEVAHTTLVDN